jgi:hypothetical protein
MRFGVFVFSALLLAAASTLAQDRPAAQRPPRNGLEDSVQGIFVAPIEGVPFSATVEINEVNYPNVGALTGGTMDRIARDKAGRIHNEIRQLLPEGSTGNPKISEVHIFDPQTCLNTYYDPQTKLASQRVLPFPPKDLDARLVLLHKPQITDLGTTVLDGIKCQGTRETFSGPAPSDGTGNPAILTYEFWYSEDLHINILTHFSVSDGGEKTVAVLQIKREQPDPALFEVPEGYAIINVTPPPSTLVRRQPQVNRPCAEPFIERP